MSKGGLYDLREAFYLSYEGSFKTSELGKKSIGIDGRYLNHLCFSDNIVLMK